MFVCVVLLWKSGCRRPCLWSASKSDEVMSRRKLLWPPVRLQFSSLFFSLVELCVLLMVHFVLISYISLVNICQELRYFKAWFQLVILRSYILPVPLLRASRHGAALVRNPRKHTVIPSSLTCARLRLPGAIVSHSSMNGLLSEVPLMSNTFYTWGSNGVFRGLMQVSIDG